MPTAIRLWKLGAGKIEADLHRFYRIDIGDWHRGTLSSRKLLVLLENLPAASSYRTAVERGGRQTRAERVAEEQLNEQLRLRSVYEAVNSRGEVRWDPSEYAWLDPVDQIERDRAAAEAAAEAARAEQDFMNELGFS